MLLNGKQVVVRHKTREITRKRSVSCTLSAEENCRKPVCYQGKSLQYRTEHISESDEITCKKNYPKTAATNMAVKITS